MAIIFDFDPPVGDSKQVEVHFFRAGELIHTRTVNAVFTADVYDPDLTEDRVEEVARGVTHKFSVGAIQKPSLDDVEVAGPETEKLTKAEKDARRAEKVAKRTEKQAAIAARLIKAATRIEARDARKAAAE
jgi:hypothetical protein